MRAMSMMTAFFFVVLILSGTGSVYGGAENESNTFYGQGAGSTIGNIYDSDEADTFIGVYAGHDTIANTGVANTFIGYRAGRYNTGGINNTFVGYRAGDSNNLGFFNTFLGYQAGYSNINGQYNTFLGYTAGHNSTSNFNTFVGSGAGYYNSSAALNTFIGYLAGNSTKTGSNNTSVGASAGYKNTEGIYNTFIGNDAGISNTTGSHNTSLGHSAGYSNSTGSYNVFIGYKAGYDETGSERLYINNSETTPLIYGEFDNYIVTINGKLGIGTTTPTQKIDLGGGALTLNGSDNTGAMPPGLSSQSYDPGRIDFGYGGSGGGNLEAYSKAPTNYSSPADDRRGEFRFVYGGGPTMGKVRYVHYDGTTWSTKMWLTYDGQLQMTPDGYTVSAYTDGYQWIDASSRAYKENIRGLSVEEAMETLKELSPVKFNYKSDSKETHVGFIAEDVPALVATNDRKGMSPMDVVAVLTKVVQELKAKNESLENRLLAIETLIKTPR